MDDLVGGSLTLEQRYDIDSYVGRFGGVEIYRGTQRPLERDIWIHVLPHPKRRDPLIARNWVDRVRSAVDGAKTIQSDHVLNIVDFGEVEEGVPFIVYECRDAVRLSDRVGALSSEEIELLTADIAEVISQFADRGFSHGALSPEFIFTNDDEVWLIQTGIGFTRAEVDALDGADLTGLFSFPPPIILDKASHESSSDAYGVAALAYFLASGVHPHLDTDGELIGHQPEPLETYGIEKHLSDAIAAQFSDDTRDLDAMRASAFATKTVEVSRPPVTEDDEPLLVRDDEPSNVITILGGIIILLLVTNALTFLWAVRNPSEETDVSAPRVETTVIPQAFELNTDPSGVDVIDVVSGKALGQTPLSVDPRRSNGELKLKLEKRGFVPVEISLTKKNGVDDAVLVRLKRE